MVSPMTLQELEYCWGINKVVGGKCYGRYSFGSKGRSLGLEGCGIELRQCPGAVENL